MIEHRVITGEDNRFQYEFAICTLVTSWEEYALMKSSFIDCGFSENCEYLVADNTHQNASDAYQAISNFLATNRSRYLVIVHQDVRCIDHRSDLLSCLAQLTALDDTWALCGNAGAQGYHNDIIHIMNNGKIVKSDNVPAKVNSLDENFLLINMNASLAISADISGFHLYGTDLAIIADFLGHSCYVIPFLVNHISLGNLAELKKQVPAFVSVYGEKLRSRYIQTPCTSFYLSNSPAKNTFFNLPFIFFFVKAIQRFRQVRGLVAHGRRHAKSIQVLEKKG